MSEYFEFVKDVFAVSMTCMSVENDVMILKALILSDGKGVM